jgi:hypothetical protein
MCENNITHGVPVISLCIPTNGIIEWVFPVLDAIYDQQVPVEKFEVVVTDNGDNQEFKQMMLDYSSKHVNLKYSDNRAFLFNNQLEALRLSTGEYLKFLNHRSILSDGALNSFINFIEMHRKDKPVIFFSNGNLSENDEIFTCGSFDEFVKRLGHYASWTTCVGIWREDFERIPADQKYSKISPHSAVLFSERHKDNYIINDMLFATDIDDDQTKKGKYDLFAAFGYEELSITMELLCDGDITPETFKHVKKTYKYFLQNLYLNFCILKKPCSYILTGFDPAMGIFFSKKEIIVGAYLRLPRRALNKLKRMITRK